MYHVGLFDYPPTIQPIPAQADAAVAQEIEETGAVLLKNSGGQLPLNATATQSIAVIGSHADTWVLSGGGSAQVDPVGGGIHRAATVSALLGHRHLGSLFSDAGNSGPGA